MEQIRQNVTSELSSVFWHEKTWNGEEMLVAKSEVKTCVHIREFTWHCDARYRNWC